MMAVSRAFCVDLTGGLDTVQIRHRYVDDGYIRRFSRRSFDSLSAIRCLCYDLEARMAFEKNAKAAAHYGVIVGEQDTNRLHLRSDSRL